MFEKTEELQDTRESVERTFCYACTLSSASSSFVHQSDSFGKFTSQMFSILSASKPPAASFLMKTEGIIPY
jgi:phosphate/sulfate permease